MASKRRKAAKKPAAKKTSASKVVQATGTAATGSKPGASATAIESAMVKALQDAQAKGVNDPAGLKAAMQKAREEAVK